MFQEIAVTPRGYQTPGRFSKKFQYLSEILTKLESIFNRCSVAHVGWIDEKLKFKILVSFFQKKVSRLFIYKGKNVAFFQFKLKM